MSILFEAFELLGRSNLFDAEYYLKSNPEVAAQNLDPLMHYLERGARERRDPSALFDTAYYLRQCQDLGEQPENALLHYLTAGRARGLRHHPTGTAPVATGPVRGAAMPTLLYIDVPKIANGVAEAAVQGGLAIAGWSISPQGVAEIAVLVDGQRAAVAHHGIRRPDVASARPDLPGAMQSGFAAHIAPRLLPPGKHVVSVIVRAHEGGGARKDFGIEVAAASVRDHGPGTLRRRVGQREASLVLAQLARQGHQPSFDILVAAAAGPAQFERLTETLESLRRQSYKNWRLCLVSRGDPQGARRPAAAQRSALTRGLEELGDRVVVTTAIPAPQAPEQRQYLFAICAGDRFASDALQEFALQCAADRSAEFLYCDDRRLGPADEGITPYYKPMWSPDLLLSSNYIGRAWCATPELVVRAKLRASDLTTRCGYDVVLRLTETARKIRGIQQLLFEATPDRIDAVQAERKALAAALARRGIDAGVRTGFAEHQFRIKRRLRTRELVSIIIPTCAADGLVQTCIESLRELTAYRSYEVIALENIPADRSSWRKWLQRHADRVIPMTDAFNWSRFNNRGAARAKGRHLLFLNDDVQVLEAEWLESLVEHAQRSEVGVVGAQLLYPDGSVQHAGMALDPQGRGRHVFRHLRRDDPGYFGLALSQRNVIGVTGACLMTRRDVFERLGGFDEAHTIINGDLDYCLRSWEAGLLNVYTPHATLIHHELASRSTLGEKFDARQFSKRWSAAIAAGDPYFNPNLSIDNDLVQPEQEPVELIFAGEALYARPSVQRILVVKLDHIGDTITALAPVRRLRQAFPRASITVLAGRSTQAIWKGEPGVDETLEFNLFHARSGLGMIDTGPADRSALAASLAGRHFDIAIDLRKQPDTRFVLQLAQARILAGFDHQGRFPWLDVAMEWDEDVPLRAKRAHVSDDLDRLVDALVACGDAEIPEESRRAVGVLRKGLADRLLSRPFVCVHVASGSELRQWPLEQFARLTEQLLADGSLHVALIGGGDEADMTRQVIKGLSSRDRVFDLAGKLALSELPVLLSRAALFVGNNSGPQHLAASLGVPTVGIHSGVVDAHEWGPNGPRAVAVRRRMSCSPCFIEKAKDCPRSLACLTGLAPGDVYRQCRRLLDMDAPPTRAGQATVDPRRAPGPAR